MRHLDANLIDPVNQPARDVGGESRSVALDSAVARVAARRRAVAGTVAGLCTFGARLAVAGPPFVTDDPVPVDPRHWEVYLGSADEHGADGWSGTAPHLEVNYGAAPGLQLHAIVPLAYARPAAGPRAYAFGDVEVGAKYRFLTETRHRPQVGAFPIVVLPTGDRDRGLGDGHPQLFLPVWLQKSVGPWIAYGGGGLWFHPGAGNQSWLLVGLELQRRLSSMVTVGAELFHATADAVDGAATTGFNVGLMLDLTDVHHLLASAGRGLGGDPSLQAYLAYQLTFGPSS